MCLHCSTLFPPPPPSVNKASTCDDGATGLLHSSPPFIPLPLFTAFSCDRLPSDAYRACVCTHGMHPHTFVCVALFFFVVSFSSCAAVSLFFPRTSTFVTITAGRRRTDLDMKYVRTRGEGHEVAFPLYLFSLSRHTELPLREMKTGRRHREREREEGKETSCLIPVLIPVLPFSPPSLSFSRPPPPPPPPQRETSHMLAPRGGRRHRKREREALRRRRERALYVQRIA